jgi:hypothetical protein
MDDRWKENKYREEIDVPQKIENIETVLEEIYSQQKNTLSQLSYIATMLFLIVFLLAIAIWRHW